jgi:hypothetical protein
MTVPTPSSTVHSTADTGDSYLDDPLNYAVRGFIAFLQTIFEARPPGCYRWLPEIEETELVITEESPVRVQAVEQRPAISVILGPVRFNGSSLDDLVTVSAKNAQETHTDLIPGNMTLNCLSRVRQECRSIAWQCARMTWILRKVFISETLFHEMGRNNQISSVSPAGELVVGDTEGDWHVVSVTVPFFLQWSDTVTPLGNDWNGRPIHPLNAISMRLRTRLLPAQQNLTHEQTAGVRLWGEQAPGRSDQIAARQSRLKPASIRGRQIRTVPESSKSVVLEQESKV